MNERRAMYESYWAFEAGKWTEIDSVDRQAVPKIYDTFSKKKLDLTELLQKYFILPVLLSISGRTEHVIYFHQVIIGVLTRAGKFLQ